MHILHSPILLLHFRFSGHLTSLTRIALIAFFYSSPEVIGSFYLWNKKKISDSYLDNKSFFCWYIKKGRRSLFSWIILITARSLSAWTCTEKVKDCLCSLRSKEKMHFIDYLRSPFKFIYYFTPNSFLDGRSYRIVAVHQQWSKHCTE